AMQLARVKQISKQAFTLAEVLITLAIIGVVAAVSIPSVISNSQQQEFKTGLRKAVSVLNSAITMNMALDGETPYDNANLFGFLMRHMAVIESTTSLYGKYLTTDSSGWKKALNAAFYTTDGMRYELRRGDIQLNAHPLYEEQNIFLCTKDVTGINPDAACGGCGALGLNSNTDNTTKPPCLLAVDVNGDRKPNPANADCKSESCSAQNKRKYSDPDGKKLTDLFTIMITDKEAIPYGIAAQKAMYQSQK
ncbi:MAG: type II secretion system protein, partial [bacterium]|nr:type II secretion system protein [bacterium]